MKIGIAHGQASFLDSLPPTIRVLGEYPQSDLASSIKLLRAFVGLAVVGFAVGFGVGFEVVFGRADGLAVCGLLVAGFGVDGLGLSSPR